MSMTSEETTTTTTTKQYFTVGDANRNGLEVSFDFYMSKDCPRPGTPPKEIISHRNAIITLRTPRDAQSFYDILILAIDKAEVTR